jgi:hypothetical protein
MHEPPLILGAVNSKTRSNIMDSTMIRIIAAVGVLLVLGLIIWRRSKKAAAE